MSDQPSDTPPLGIRHLLGWTAITGLTLTLLQHLTREPTPPDAFDQFDRIWTAAMYGVSAGTLLIMVLRRCGGMAFPTQPGEFYLVASGAGSTIMLACWWGYLYLLAPLPGAGLWLFYLGHVLSLIPDFWAARNTAAVSWRRLMWTRLAFNGVQAMLISSQFQVDKLSGYWVAVGVEVVVTLLWLPMLWRADMRRHLHRGWLHGVGVLCWLLSCLHAIGWWLWAYLGQAI